MSKKIRENLARNYKIKLLIAALESARNSLSNSIHIVEANIPYKKPCDGLFFDSSVSQNFILCDINKSRYLLSAMPLFLIHT